MGRQSVGFSRGRTFARAPRRITSWELGPGQQAAQTAISSSIAVLMAAGAQVLVDGLTMVRLRGELLLTLTTAAGVNEGFNGAFGIAIGSTNGFAAGVASMEMPITEESWDGWLYHRYFSLLAGGAIQSSAAEDTDQVNSTTAALRIEVDSRAMRKLAVDEVIYAAIEVAEIGTCSMTTHFNSRILVKLP